MGESQCFILVTQPA